MTTLGGGGSPWSHLISSMEAEGCVGPCLPLQCPTHKERSVVEVKDSAHLKAVLESPQLVCQLQCGLLMPCETHHCTKMCRPQHTHSVCMTMVDFSFPPDMCPHGHSAKKRCHENITSLKCKQVMEFKFRKCQHSGSRLCHQQESSLVCKTKVDFCFPSCGHPSPHKKICSETMRWQCKQQVQVRGSCGHTIIKECWQNAATLQCTTTVEFYCTKCHEKNKRQCHEDETLVPCRTKVKYRFPSCGHLSPRKKFCSEVISWPCSEVVSFSASCGHHMERKCSQEEASIRCSFRPCSRGRVCGHPCTNTCGEDCDLGKCDTCDLEEKRRLWLMRKKATNRLKNLNKDLTNGNSWFQMSTLSSNKKDSTYAEYLRIEDLVMNNIVPIHKWVPHITKIEKVTNLKLEMKFYEAKMSAHYDYEDLKFHGTGEQGVISIPKEGFRLGSKGMYGAGIYFATDSSKSAQEIYTKGCNKLLVCKVLLGKSMNVLSADDKLDLKTLKQKGFDSVFAPRNSKTSNGVLNDEFVIYNPHQAVVEYIVHYETGTRGSTPVRKAPLPNFAKKEFKVSEFRSVKTTDPDFLTAHYAHSHYYRMMATRSPAARSRTVTSITVILNSQLANAFEEKKKKFAAQKIPADPIYAYHGTPVDSATLDKILKDNLDMKYAKRQAHGPGNYFSEFPDVSLGYGHNLIFCQVLSGKEYKGNGHEWKGYNSKVVRPQEAGFSEMVIVQDPAQILPLCLIHF